VPFAVGVRVDPETVQGPEVTEKVSLALLCPPEVVSAKSSPYVPEVEVIVSEVGIARLKVKVAEELVASK
jgi:hypothetical protein